jgi:hypothetical protein
MNQKIIELEKQIVELKIKEEKLNERNKLLTKRYIFCSHCDYIILDDNNEPETSQYNVYDCEMCDQLFCKTCINDDTIFYIDEYSGYDECYRCMICVNKRDNTNSM